MSAAGGIDLEHLRKFTMGDVSLELELLGLFREQCGLWLKTLDPKEADAKAWASGAHAIKGSARAVGAHAVSDACQAAEDLAGEKGTPVSRALALDALRAAVDAAIADVARLEHRAGTKFRSGAA
jgi:HPt (histidine-containing phosphotransfer) domain-containing protein